jgi:hypothetical protein
MKYSVVKKIIATTGLILALVITGQVVAKDISQSQLQTIMKNEQ